MNPVPIISLRGVTRWYGQVVALREATIDIFPGILGLLGPNGAGKTTFLRLVTGSMPPSKGSVDVLGGPAFGRPDLFTRVGYCPDHDNFPEFMTGREFVVMLMGIHGFEGGEARERAARGLERVKAAEFADRKIAGYSKGMRQRLKLAQALAHDPELLFLDEPLNGADPLIRRDVIELVRQLGREGKSVIVSSHVLHEVETMTTNIILIHKGKLKAAGNVHEIRQMIDKHPHSVEIATARPRDLAAILAREPDVTEISIREDRVVARTPAPERFYSRLAPLVLESGIDVGEIRSPDDNLDAVFRFLTEG